MIDRIALGTLPLIFVSILNIQNGNAQCVKAPCHGENKVPGGNALGYKFITTSRVYPGHNVEVYETCVENQSDRDMEFNWFIPGPSTFVPAGYSCSSPRSKTYAQYEDAPSYAGCLYYGNDWARDHATFIPHVDDQSKINAEQNDPQCKKVTTALNASGNSDLAAAKTALKDGIKVQLSVFAPSSLKDATDTMAHVEATVSLNADPNDNEKYIHKITLRASPFRDSKPDFGALKVVAEKNRVADFYNDIPDGRIQLNSEEITISTQLTIPKYPMLDTVAFRIVGADDRGVATLFVPYLIERE